MRFVTLLLALFLIISCDSFGNISDEEYVARAKVHMDKKELRAASIELKNALVQNANNTQARWLLGEVYIELGNGPSAEKELRRAQKLGVAKEAVVIPLAESLLLQKKYSDLLAEIQPGGTLSATQRAHVHALRGNAYLEDGVQDKAAEEYRTGYELDPEQTSIMVGFARLAATQGKKDDARTWIDKALQVDAEFAAAWSLLGNIELAEGNAAEAEAALSNSIKYQPFGTKDLAKRALARFYLEKYPEGEADIEKLKQRGLTKHPYVNYVAGVGFFRQEKYREAATAFQESYKKWPSSLQLNIYLATTYYILGELEQAHVVAQRLEATAPQSLAAKQLLGAIEISRSEFDAAIDLLQKALRDSPKNVTILRTLATLMLLEGNTSQGTGYYQQVVSLEPDSPQARKMLMVAKLMDGQELDKSFEIGAEKGTTGSDNISQEFLYALAAFRDGRLSEAIERAQKLHERNPENVEPLKLIAAAYLRAGQMGRARTELEKVLQLNPVEPSATKNLAKLEVVSGNLEHARTLLTALVEANPQDEEAILLQAEVETHLGTPADGIKVLEKAVERNPSALSTITELAAAYLNAGDIKNVLDLTRDLNNKQQQEQPRLLELRGKAQMLAGDAASARLSFKRWTALAPDSAQAHYLYGDSLARNGDIDLARKQLKQAIELNPNHLPAQVGEIKMLVQAGDIESAKKRLSDLKQKFGDRPEVLGIEGWFALGTGDYAMAEERLASAMEQNPDAELALLLVKALWVQKKTDEAIEAMKGWLRERPQDIAVLNMLAESYMALNRKEEASGIYADIITLYPKDIAALNNLAWLNREKNLQQAIEYAERAYNITPDDPNVLDTFGMLLAENGNSKRGNRMIKHAAELAPQDLEIQLHYGRTLIQQEDLAKAREVLNDIIKKGPDTASSNEANTLLESISIQ